MTSDAFIKRLFEYFGPWREDAGPVIKRWLDKRDIQGHSLDDVYFDLVEYHKIEPVNTISIADIAKLLDTNKGDGQYLKLEGPRDVVERDEGSDMLAELRETLKKLCDAKNVRRRNE